MEGRREVTIVILALRKSRNFATSYSLNREYVALKFNQRRAKFRPFCATEAENLFIETKGISIKCQPINQLPLDRHIQRGDKIFYRSISVTSVKIATRIPFGFTTTRYFPSFLSSPPRPFGKTFLVVVVVVVVEARIQSRI